MLNTVRLLGINMEGDKVQTEAMVLSTPTKCEEYANVGDHYAPCVGMQFDSIDDAKKYYNVYARHAGFGISTITSKFNGDVCVFAHFGCWKNGKSRKKADACRHHDSPKIGYTASLKVKLDRSSGKLVVDNILIDHNHELSTVTAAYLRSHRRIITPEKTEIKNMRSVGISTSKIVSCIAKRKGGVRRLQFIEKDCMNFLSRERESKLRDGDAQRMLRHFMEMKCKDPTFFYAFDLNENDQLSNVFWIDGRSRMACNYFTDVITFDTTYVTNTYQMPFAPFVGVNHHGQSILLGCALLCNEKIETFVWVFKCWMEENGGVSPKAIITDQDKAIEAAISEVFTSARHRFCLWHILQKIPKKIGHICTKYPEFMEEFDGCIYDSTTIHEFEEKWDQILDKYDECKENDWLQDVYQYRAKWVPVFLNDHFFAGMSTSQRSESFNHFFDGFVQAKTTLEEFIVQYRVALEKRWDAENKADVKTMETIAFLQTSSSFEKQAADIYTRDIFKKVQHEVLEIASCQPTILHANEKSLLMRVKSSERIKVKGVEKNIIKEFTVSYDKNDEMVTCGYRCFEFRGYLCRHALMAFQLAGVSNIPEKYFMRRWTKEMRYRHTIDEYNMGNTTTDDHSCRYSNLIYRFMKVAEVGSSSEVAFKVALEEIPQLLKKMIDGVNAQKLQQASTQGVMVNDPPLTARKGRPKEKRIQSSIEKLRKRCKTNKVATEKNPSMGSTPCNVDIRPAHPMIQPMSFPMMESIMHPIVRPIMQPMQTLMQAMMQHSINAVQPNSNEEENNVQGCDMMLGS